MNELVMTLVGALMFKFGFEKDDVYVSTDYGTGAREIIVSKGGKRYVIRVEEE